MPRLRDWKQAHEAAYEPAMKLRPKVKVEMQFPPA